MKKKAILTLLIFFTIFNLGALEIKEGRMKLVLHETSGRISIFYQDKLVSNDYTSLLLKQDPRTSGITLIVNNKTERVGDTFEYEQTVSETRTGAEFNWKSKRLDITESFSFVTSAGNSIADGIKIDVTIENISEETLSIGMKYLFDTYLGEENRSKVHFYLADDSEILSETLLKGIMPDFWVSSESIDATTGFLAMLDNKVVTAPDKVIFANWKRLDESGWTLNIKEDRNFNLLPYSINDSAVCHYYEPIRVPSGGKRVITLVMGNVSDKGFSNTVRKDDQSTLDDLYNRVTSDTSGSVISEENTIRNELTLTEDLITHIERLLDSNEPLTADELETLTTMIEKIESTKSKLDN